MRLIAYLRTSSAAAGNGDSLDAQRDACEEWAAANGHSIAETFADDGVSGRLGPEDRPALAATLAALEAGEANGLIVHRLDRLARELHIQEAILGAAWGHGATVYEAVGGEVLADDPADPMRRFVRQVMGAAAELERGMVTARLQRGRRRKHASGGYAGGRTLAFGQRVEGEGKAARRILDPEAEAVIEEMRAMRADGVSYRAIADAMEKAGVPTAQGGRWHPMTVKRLLSYEL